MIDGKGIAAVAVMKFNLGTSSEKRLVNDIRKRDNAAIKKLYDTWSGYLFALCRRYISDKDIAEDILQESFMKIISSVGSFEWKGEGSLKAWMSRITVNEALQYLRKQKKCSFVEYTDNLPDTDDAPDPDVSRIPQQVIMDKIRGLSDGYRTIFNLYVFEGKSHKEIADMLGITESTSASQYHRARKILAKELTEYMKRES